MEEVFKDIGIVNGIDYTGHYQISTNCTVKSIIRKGVTYERILTIDIDTSGYPKVALYKDDKRTYYSIHRLMALTFLDNPNNYPQVNHINCIKTDNRIENLEWCTVKQNSEHAIKNGRCFYPKGEQIGNSKLKEFQVLEIRKLLKLKQSKASIARNYNVSEGAIYSIQKNLSWKHL